MVIRHISQHGDAWVSNDDYKQLEALLVKWVGVGSAIKQCLEIMDNGERRITTGCVFQQLDAVLAESKKLEVKP